jgi:hypothetical protein
MTVFIDSKTGSLRIGTKKCKHQKKGNVVEAARKFLSEAQLYKKVLKSKKELCREIKEDAPSMSRQMAMAAGKGNLERYGQWYRARKMARRKAATTIQKTVRGMLNRKKMAAGKKRKRQ